MGVDCLCRLCASKNENLVQIYDDEGKKLNLATKINQCLRIWLKPDDILPKTVCMECCLKLDQYFDFFELCAQSQKSLMAIIDENKNANAINKFETEIDIDNDYFMKSVLNHASVNEITENGSATDNINDNDVNDDCEDDYQNGSADDFDDNEQFDYKVENNCDYNYEYEGVGGNQDESSQFEQIPSVLNDCRGTSRRKLRVPIKRSSKHVVNNDSKASKNNTIRKRPNRRCVVKNVAKKVKQITRTLSHKNEAIVKTNNLKSKKPSLSEMNKNVDRSEDEENDGTDEENSEKNNQISSNRKSMEGYAWKCTDCSAELKTLSSLKDHHQVFHNQPPNFKCSHCTKVYTRYRSFARHIKLHGNPKKFSCEVCGKGFSQKTVLQSHKTVHTEERPHVCPQCGKAFKQFSSLYLHSKCHLPDEIKPKFPCTVCPKQFSTKHTLETHMKIHTGERNYICDICGKSFIAKGSLDYHILAHNDSKPHSCKVCNKGFKTIRLLTKHSTLHTGIKPHQCDVCGKQFREKSALKEHNRIHTGAMPYSCEFCGKLFRFKGILTVHRRQHTGERPYSCQDCRREFTNWANYNKHMKRRHRNSDNNQNNGTTSVNNPSTSRLGVRRDLLVHASMPHQSVEQTLHQTSPSQQCATHLITVMSQHQQTEDELPPPISVQQLAPISSIQLHMHQPVIYNDNTSATSNSESSNYKLLPDDNTNSGNNDVYRVSHYVPTHAINGMSYYIPPIHQPILPTRNQ